MTRRALSAASLLAALALIFPAISSAEFGDEFGFQEVNRPGAPTAPAFPGEIALWAGTCDLGSAVTADVGVGVLDGGIDPPPIRAHCIDMPDQCCEAGSPWSAGNEPRWRLSPVVQAGAHPDATATFYFNRPGTNIEPDGGVRNIIAKLPPGVVGNPEATTKCAAIAAQAIPPACRPSDQVGVSTIGFPFPVPIIPQINARQTRAVYNIEARDTVTAEFTIAYVSNLFNVPITARGRTNGDYGVDTLALLIPNFVQIGGQTFTLWGVPWATEHDKFRANEPGTVSGRSFYSGEGDGELDTGWAPSDRASYVSAWGPIKPFFTNPTECSGKELPVSIDMDSWQNPVSLGGSYVNGVSSAPPVTGCEKLEFDPQITLRPDVKVADSPSGLDVELTIPQNNDPPEEALGNPNLPFDPDDSSGAPAYWKTDAGLATAHLKDTVVRLPRGTSFNPAAANGLRGCTTAQAGLTALKPKVTFNNDPHNCPDTSKIGTVEIISPLLPDPLDGSVYAAPQNDNPFPGSLTAIYMIAQDHERGLSIKLPGKVDLDPATGQIATTFLDNPQLPFGTFRLKFKTGPRAPLNTPATCGQFKNSADFVPWSFPASGPPALVEDPFDISAMPNGFGCVSEPEDRSFAPGFEAGSTSPQAGAHTGFVLNVTRRDGEQEISGISLEMAPGLTGRLAGIPYCSEGEIAAARARTGLQETTNPSCPAASYLGAVDTLAGAGPLPLPTAGRLYLSGPYDADGSGPKPRSPLSVTTIVPAIAGGAPGEPAFDLGNVVIRTGINVDRATAQVRIDSTDVPYIVGGVPLRIRSVAVALDRPGFMLNPTSCEALAIGGGIRGSADPLDPGDDTLASVSSRFQAAGCESLGFKPKLKLRLKGKPTRGSYQALTATLTARPGDANIGRVAVTMPRSLFLAQEHLNTICTRVQFAARACPAGSVYGNATASSPLLDSPLSGNVYLRSSSNLLPDLVAELRGPEHQPIEIELVGRTDSVHQSLRNTFDVVPDAPVSSFTLNLRGGKKALLRASANLCRSTERPLVRFGAQNGRQLTLKPKLALKCKGKARKGTQGKKGAKGKGAKRG